MVEHIAEVLEYFWPPFFMACGMYMGHAWGKCKGWELGYRFGCELHEKDFFCVTEFLKGLRKKISPENKEALDRLDEWTEFEETRKKLKGVKPTDA